ncbi:hypothetical protein Taro_040726, partial [Colocasia esculenta]|nr:hypothetical protein [Colocasia esculenta]
MPQALVLSSSFVEIWLCKLVIYIKCGVFLCVFTDCGLVSLARLRPVRGRRTRVKYVIGLTGLAEAFCHSWYQSKKFLKWLIEEIGVVEVMIRRKDVVEVEAVVEVRVVVVEVGELAWVPEQVQHRVQELLHELGHRRALLEVDGLSEEDESVDAWVAACHGIWVDYAEAHIMWMGYSGEGDSGWRPLIRPDLDEFD